MTSIAFSDLTWLVLAFGFGALWGSFLNVCIARIPLGMSVVWPGSHCFSCQKSIRAWDNVPILSYFILRGRCRHCGASFGGRHAFVEFLTGVLSVLVFWQFALDSAPLPVGMRVARYLTYFAFVAVLIVLSFIDLDTKRLPDIITLPSMVVFFLAGLVASEVPWLERAIGAVGGYLLVRIIADGYYYLTGREGLGLGDGKLLSVMGALLGWKALLPIVFSASFLGVFVSIPLLLAKRRMNTHPEEAATSLRRTEVPFGPFLAFSALGYLFLHKQVWALLEWFLLVD